MVTTIPLERPAAEAATTEAELREEIVRLAETLGCEALLLPLNAHPAEISVLIEQLTARLPADNDAAGGDPSIATTPPPVRRFRLTDRDREVVKALVRFRYLRTGQIHRLVFAPNAGLQMTRRRLRFLSAPEFAYLQKVDFFVSGATVRPESAFFLGPQGIALLGELGIPEPSYALDRSSRVRHRFLEHALALSEFRLQLELTLRTIPELELQRFVADFEVKEHLRNATSKERYKLYHAFPDGPRRLVVYPDALVILRHTATDARRLYFLEIDRGTEGSEVIRDKAAGYHLYRERDIQKKFGDLPRFRVLLLAPSPKHADRLQRMLGGCKGEELFWVAAATEIHPDTILTAPVWTDSGGQRRSIFRPSR